ncbi:hypothetical protein H0H81_001320 [Sphagnurus paluster]|uniref:HMG box domain-containing protein n=1 Tax=Sphagnurus paluster TaxID=117069 RepID=A0A9P7GIK0_9AGAR|nr:hypothetical protein H0H81_001320 [Sphagnurus paluster]
MFPRLPPPTPGEPRSAGDISKILGRNWKNESPETKAIFQKLAAEEKLKHERMYPDYRLIKGAPKRNDQKRRTRAPREPRGPGSTHGALLDSSTESGSAVATETESNPGQLEHDSERGTSMGMEPSPSCESTLDLSPASSANSLSPHYIDNTYYLDSAWTSTCSTAPTIASPWQDTRMMEIPRDYSPSTSLGLTGEGLEDWDRQYHTDPFDIGTCKEPMANQRFEGGSPGAEPYPSLFVTSEGDFSTELWHRWQGEFDDILWCGAGPCHVESFDDERCDNQMD